MGKEQITGVVFPDIFFSIQVHGGLRPDQDAERKEPPCLQEVNGLNQALQGEGLYKGLSAVD